MVQKPRAAPFGAARSLQRPACYLLVELPEVLPLPIEPELEPVLGVVVLGDVVLGDVVDEPLQEPLMPEELLVPPLELELEPLLNCASHSAREIWPSPFLSSAEKSGERSMVLVAPEAARRSLIPPAGAFGSPEVCGLGEPPLGPVPVLLAPDGAPD